jgi:hypothetical protein
MLFQDVQLEIGKQLWQQPAAIVVAIKQIMNLIMNFIVVHPLRGLPFWDWNDRHVSNCFVLLYAGPAC